MQILISKWMFFDLMKNILRMEIIPNIEAAGVLGAKITLVDFFLLLTNQNMTTI